MSIGSISGFGSRLGQQQSFRSSAKVDDTNDLKKQLSGNVQSNQSQSAPPLQPPGGFPGGEPPKELSKDDLTRIKDGISKAGGQGADKIDDLIKNFDKYDTGGTGKISIDQFKSYANQNGIDLPKPPQGGRPSPQGGEDPLQSLRPAGDQGNVRQAVTKAAVAGLVSKYASSVSNSNTTVEQTATSDTSGTQASSTSQSSSSSSSQSSGKSESEKSTAQLKTDAANGDADAQKELDRREAASKAKGGSAKVAVNESVSVEA